MNNTIFDLEQIFDFNILNLGNPTLANNSNYISKIHHGVTNKNLYIQFPKCTTKNGIIKNSSKMYTELNFSISQKNVIDFFENLEKFCTEKIYKNKNLWFYDSSNIEKNDIDELMLSTMKPYKHGKNFLVKAYIKSDKLHIYDENENKISIEDFVHTSEFIPLVNINNIKFSTKNFCIEIFLTQMMILLPSDEFENQFLIKTDKNKNIIVDKSSKSIPKPLHETIDSNSAIINDIKLTEQSETLTHLTSNNELSQEKTNNLTTPHDLKLYNETFETDISSSILSEKNNLLSTDLLQNDLTLNNSSLTENNYIDNIDNIDNIDKNCNTNIEIQSTPTLVKKTNNSDNNEFKYLFNNDLEIVNISDIPESKNKQDNIDIKSHEEIYLELYKNAKQKAKEIRKNAIAAFLEAKQIKNKYNLDILDNESSDDEQDFLNFNS